MFRPGHHPNLKSGMIPMKTVINKSAYESADLSKLKSLVKNLTTEIHIATTDVELQEIRTFRDKYYRVIFPETHALDNDPYYDNSHHFYYRDELGNILGTITFAYEGETGLPNEVIFSDGIQSFRDENKICVEVGRFLIAKHKLHNHIKKEFYRFIYLFFQETEVDIVIAMFKESELRFANRIGGATVLCQNTGLNFGSKNDYATVAWDLKQTSNFFFHWVGINKSDTLEENNNIEIYTINDWNNYARVFASVQTSFQRDLQQATIEHLTGHVADFGCGTAKLAPYLASIDTVNSYTGIDYSKSMVEKAQNIISKFNVDNFNIFHCKIEDFRGVIFDSAVSINCYQSWPKPMDVLTHIHSLLQVDSKFILAAPNDNLNLLDLGKETDKELISHPDYNTFKEMNLYLAANTKANFISMNDLIEQVQSVGFKVISCHQDYYQGGLNFLVLKKV